MGGDKITEPKRGEVIHCTCGKKKLKEGNIEIEIRPEWGKGKYGRWLGIVYVDGVNMNAELIEKGYAVKYEE